MLRIIVIVATTLALAYAAWADSASAIFSKFSPERGLKLDPHSAQALMNITEKAGAKKDQTQFLRIARENSVRALHSEPLSSRALRQLGVYYAMTGNVEKGRKLIELSSSLSRRDTPGQLWLTDNYLRSGKSREALQALDIVMRTQPQTREAAFGALGNALADPEFRRVFVPYVRNKPSWLKPFIQFNVSLKNPEVLSRTLIQMGAISKEVVDERTAGALLISLVNRSPIDDVRAFYLSIPGTSAKSLSAINHARAADAFKFPPVGWELMNDGNVQGFGDVKDGDVGIEALAAPGTSGTAARKLIFLRPGTYRWSGSADLGDMQGGGSASIDLLCNAGPGKWEPSSSTELKSGRNQFVFTVNADCPAQLLGLRIAGADTQNDASMRMTRMQLLAINAPRSKPTAEAVSKSSSSDAN